MTSLQECRAELQREEKMLATAGSERVIREHRVKPKTERKKKRKDDVQTRVSGENKYTIPSVFAHSGFFPEQEPYFCVREETEDDGTALPETSGKRRDAESPTGDQRQRIGGQRRSGTCARETPGESGQVERVAPQVRTGTLERYRVHGSHGDGTPEICVRLFCFRFGELSAWISSQHRDGESLAVQVSWNSCRNATVSIATARSEGLVRPTRYTHRFEHACS